MNNLKIDKETANKILYLDDNKIIKSSNTDVTELAKLAILISDGNETEFLTKKGTYVNPIIDNLTTNDNTKVLSAAQGKILNDKITNIEAQIANTTKQIDNINGETI